MVAPRALYVPKHSADETEPATTGRIHFNNPNAATTACPRGGAPFKHIRAVLTSLLSAKSRQ